MNQYNNFQQQADAYLVGGLSGEERAQFESMVASDPLLKAEFELQKDLVEAIKDRRRTQLKERLNSIPTDVLHQGIGLSNSIRWILGLSIGSVMMAGWFFYNWQSGEINSSTKNEIALATDSAKILEEAEAKASAISHKIIEAEIAQDLSPKETEVQKHSESLELKHDPEGDGKTTKKPNRNKAEAVGGVPQQGPPADPMSFAEPLVPEKNDDHGDAPAKMQMSSPAVASSMPEVSVKEDGKHKFHYQYAGGRVMLYGEFVKVYELLEFNSKANKSVVMFYDDKFYELSPTGGQIVQLKAVIDKQRIAELTAYRRRKSE